MKKIHSKLGTVIFLASTVCLPVKLYAAETQDCSRLSAKKLNEKASPFKNEIQKAATRYAVSPMLIKSVMAAESCFNPAQISPEGKLGLMQLMPATANSFGAADVFNPEANIDAGTRYLAYLLKRYDGSLAPVVAAYNANGGRVGQGSVITVPFQEINEPVKQTLSTLLKLENNKKSDKQAQGLLQKWQDSEESYQAALLELPEPEAKVKGKSKGKSKEVKPHWASLFYKRAPESRGCVGFSAKVLNQKAAPYKDLIQKASKRYGVDSALIKSMIAAESCYREMVVSYKGASGLMQLMPETAEELGVFDIFDPQENINAGTRYLSGLLRRYNGSVTHAIAAYNAGAGRITPDEPVTISFQETRGYINNILGMLVKLETGEQGIQSANLLLADWRHAEDVYQAGLLGLPPPLSPAEIAAQEEVAKAEELAAQQAAEQTMLADMGQQPQLQLQPQPEMTLASLREDTGVMQGQEVAGQVSVQNIPVRSSAEDVVRVESASYIREDERVAQPEQAGQQPDAMMPSCSLLPVSVVNQTMIEGNGRYDALFYVVQSGQSLDMIAGTLGIHIQDILYLNGDVSTAVMPQPGRLLKVAECLK
jgi:soluble lytic murein transglycosylase-like protein